MRNSYLWFMMMLLTSLLTACGGGGGDGDSLIGADSGIAVDPYIVGAEFEEVSADGQTVLQNRSTASDENGRFSFAAGVSDGSIIRIKGNAKGLHANAPYTGVIKRQVLADDAAPFVVSPLTTLVANGMSPAAVVQMMNGAGFAGLTEKDIFSDPMAGLVGQTGNVADGDLVLLQANLATHAFMAAIQDFNYGGVTTAAITPVAFADCANAVRDILNATTYQQLAGSRPGFTVGDMANAAVIVTRTVVDGIRDQLGAGSQTVSPAMVEQLTTNAKMETETIAGNFYQSRTGGGDSTPTPPSADPAVGESLFASNCLGCHTAGTGSGVMELAGDGGFVTSRFAGGSNHNGRTLTESQIADVAAYLDSLNGGTPPSTDPGTNPGTDPGTAGDPASGETLFVANCQNCHSTPPPSGGLNARFAGGINHNGRTLTASQIADVAAYLDSLGSGTPPSTDPGIDPGTQPPLACDTCHGYPESSGAHTVHLALNGVDCDSCHANNNHNDGWVDLNFPAVWDAASGPATDNLDGTCSNIICHGGQTTPVWNSGSISVASQCRSCHAEGNSEFNSYSSGDHRKHGSYDCTVCHDAGKLSSGGHFADLSTPAFEQDAATSIRDSLNYNNNTCQSCHGTATW